VHGGAWLFGDRRVLPETLRPDQLFDELVAAGLAVASIDYRFSLEAPFPAQLHDVKAAIRYLRSFAAELGVDASRIGIWGESAGGHLATLAGLTAGRDDLEGDIGVLGPSSAVDVVVEWYGPADIEAMLGLDRAALMPPGLPPVLRTSPEELLVRGLEGAALADASPVTHVAPGAPPFLVQHGTADWVVPFDQGELLVSRLREAGVPVELEAVDGAGHIFDGHDDIDAVVRRSVAFLAEHLRPTTAT
jgi:acetyl esterase/lipase